VILCRSGQETGLTEFTKFRIRLLHPSTILVILSLAGTSQSPRAVAACTTWIGKNAKKRPRTEIIAWNNQQRDMRLSDLSPELQEYMEDCRATASFTTGSMCTNLEEQRL